MLDRCFRDFVLLWLLLMTTWHSVICSVPNESSDTITNQVRPVNVISHDSILTNDQSPSTSETHLTSFNQSDNSSPREFLNKNQAVESIHTTENTTCINQRVPFVRKGQTRTKRYVSEPEYPTTNSVRIEARPAPDRSIRADSVVRIRCIVDTSVGSPTFGLLRQRSGETEAQMISEAPGSTVSGPVRKHLEKLFSVTVTERDNGATFFCEVVHAGDPTGMARSDGRNYNVTYPPKAVHVSTSPSGAVSESVTKKFICQLNETGSNPASNLRWMQLDAAGAQLSMDDVHITPTENLHQSFGVIVVRSNLTVTARRSSNGRRFECGVEYLHKRTMLRSEEILEVKYPTTVKLLSLPSEPIIGQTVLLACQASDGNPQVGFTYSWYVASRTQIGGKDVSKMDHRKQTSSGESNSDNVDKHQSNDVASSNSVNTAVLTEDYLSKMVRLTGQQGSQLNLSNIKLNQRGLYACEVANAGGESAAFINLDLLYQPIVDDRTKLHVNSQIGETVSLHLYLDANPSWADVLWFQLNNVDQIKPSAASFGSTNQHTDSFYAGEYGYQNFDDYYEYVRQRRSTGFEQHTIDKRNSRLPVGTGTENRAHIVASRGIPSIPESRDNLTFSLTFHGVMQADFGQYLCQVRHRLGVKEVRFHLTKKSDIPTTTEPFRSDANLTDPRMVWCARAVGKFASVFIHPVDKLHSLEMSPGSPVTWEALPSTLRMYQDTDGVDPSSIRVIQRGSTTIVQFKPPQQPRFSRLVLRVCRRSGIVPKLIDSNANNLGLSVSHPSSDNTNKAVSGSTSRQEATYRMINRHKRSRWSYYNTLEDTQTKEHHMRGNEQDTSASLPLHPGCDDYQVAKPLSGETEVKLSDSVQLYNFRLLIYQGTRIVQKTPVFFWQPDVPTQSGMLGMPLMAMAIMGGFALLLIILVIVVLIVVCHNKRKSSPSHTFNTLKNKYPSVNTSSDRYKHEEREMNRFQNCGLGLELRSDLGSLRSFQPSEVETIPLMQQVLPVPNTSYDLHPGLPSSCTPQASTCLLDADCNSLLHSQQSTCSNPNTNMTLLSNRIVAEAYLAAARAASAAVSASVRSGSTDLYSPSTQMTGELGSSSILEGMERERSGQQQMGHMGVADQMRNGVMSQSIMSGMGSNNNGGIEPLPTRSVRPTRSISKKPIKTSELRGQENRRRSDLLVSPGSGRSSNMSIHAPGGSRSSQWSGQMSLSSLVANQNHPSQVSLDAAVRAAAAAAVASVVQNMNNTILLQHAASSSNLAVPYGMGRPSSRAASVAGAGGGPMTGGGKPGTESGDGESLHSAAAYGTRYTMNQCNSTGEITPTASLSHFDPAMIMQNQGQFQQQQHLYTPLGPVRPHGQGGGRMPMLLRPMEPGQSHGHRYMGSKTYGSLQRLSAPTHPMGLIRVDGGYLARMPTAMVPRDHPMMQRGQIMRGPNGVEYIQAMPNQTNSMMLYAQSNSPRAEYESVYRPGTDPRFSSTPLPQPPVTQSMSHVPEMSQALIGSKPGSPRVQGTDPRAIHLSAATIKPDEFETLNQPTGHVPSSTGTLLPPYSSSPKVSINQHENLTTIATGISGSQPAIVSYTKSNDHLNESRGVGEGQFSPTDAGSPSSDSVSSQLDNPLMHPSDGPGEDGEEESSTLGKEDCIRPISLTITPTSGRRHLKAKKHTAKETPFPERSVSSVNSQEKTDSTASASSSLRRSPMGASFHLIGNGNSPQYTDKVTDDLEREQNKVVQSPGEVRTDSTNGVDNNNRPDARSNFRTGVYRPQPRLGVYSTVRMNKPMERIVANPTDLDQMQTDSYLNQDVNNNNNNNITEPSSTTSPSPSMHQEIMKVLPNGISSPESHSP